MEPRKPALLALEDGSIFKGISIGAEGVSSGEVVFNTSMTGYQEILTDPSYAQQIVTLTYPHIGNTGVNSEDVESGKVWAAGLVIRDLPLLVSSWRSEKALDVYLRENNVVGIADIDTRRLTRLLRDKGAQNGCIIAGDNVSAEEALAKARAFPGLKGMDLAKVVSRTQVEEWTEGQWDIRTGYRQLENPQFHVVVYDFGVKRNILRILVSLNCRVTVVPAQAPVEDVLVLKPDGVLLANGPGDPEPCDYAIRAIQALLQANIPTFGICLGHQLLALASGAKTMKMKQGHHGGNHPVQNLVDGTVMITSQNHGFAVDEASLPANLVATHKSLFDGTLQGVRRTDVPAFSFQGHPEAGPGPRDVSPLFDQFINMMRTYQRMKA